MVALPTSIEAALKDAGFCGTEIVVLRRLLEDEALTLRELAAKTGKSTGVLDQALKKLLRKGIINRQEFNSTTKYSLLSINAISAWMNRDMHEKRSELSRRLQNFEAFISTVEMHRNRPEMEYFDGEDGIKAAYEKLITFPAKEILIYDPILWTAEEDPLRDFRVQLFRKRRARGLFCRVIGPNTPLGRRFQSRDPFEFRKTTLVEPESNLVNMEKLIISEVVACISHEEKRACFIRFRDMADSERKLFNGIWDREVQREKASSGAQSAPASSAIAPSTSTRVLSAVREFFLSKKSLVTFLILGVLSAVLTGGLYMRTSAFNLQRMKDKVQAIATTAAFQFDARDLDQLRVESDWKKPEWAKVVNQLRDIRQSNEDILFAYILRKRADDPTKGEFVADSHSLNPYANTDDDPTNDVNVGEDDGIFDPEGAEKLQWPGQPYDTMPPEAFDAFTVPTTNKDFYQDLFGKVITGYAPIKDSAGNPVAVVAIDMEYAQLGRFNAQSFRPLWYFLGIFVLFVFIRLFAFNRSLFKELWELSRRAVAIIAMLGLVSAILTTVLYFRTSQLNLQRMKDKVQAIATTAAFQLDARDLDQLRIESDWKKPQWAKVARQLREVKVSNSDLMYVYIFRKKVNDPTKAEFVADPDSINPYANTDDDPTNDVDLNGDGKIEPGPDGGDFLAWPGQDYPTLPKEGFEAYNGPTTNENFYEDQWGKVITGYAPVRNADGKAEAVIAVDMRADTLRELNAKTFTPLLYFLGFLFLFLLFKLPAYHRAIFKEVWTFAGSIRIRWYVPVIIAVVVALIFGIRYYLWRSAVHSVGLRMQSIAATAAPSFSHLDLDSLRKAEDMKTETYQQAFKLLNDVRNKNPGVKYAYIFRQTSNSEMLEFVADADSNHFLPELMDFTFDGKLDDADENVYPGFVTVDSNQSIVSALMKNGLSGYDIAIDQWGKWISGFAAIHDKNGEVMGVLGVDFDLKEL